MMNFAGQTCGDPCLNSRLFKPALLGLLLSAQQALAEPADCAADPTSQACKLQHTLHLLHWFAAILAVLLIVVVVAAVLTYRRNMAKSLTPDD